MPTEQLPLSVSSDTKVRGLRDNGSGQLFGLERAESLNKD